MAGWQIELIIASRRPTLGAGRLLEHIAERSVHRSESGVQRVLVHHGLGPRARPRGWHWPAAWPRWRR